MSKATVRTSRLEARIDPGILSLVKRAAELQGRSVSDFVITAAQEAAYKTIEDSGIRSHNHRNTQYEHKKSQLNNNSV